MEQSRRAGGLLMTSAVTEGRLLRFVRQAAHVGADAAIFVGSVILAVWAASKAAEADQRAPIVAQFNGHEGTFTSQFTTTGPWYVSWQGLGAYRRALGRFHAKLAALAVAAGYKPVVTIRAKEKRYSVTVDLAHGDPKLRLEGQG